MNLANISLDYKLGQRFIFGVNSDKIDIILKLIKEKYIGGVILYKRNYKTYDDMIKVIKRIKAANKDNKWPLFISIDQEGGVVNRLPEDIHNLVNISNLSRVRPNMVSSYADIIGRILNNTGINMDFAPVVDMDNHSKSKALYKRCFDGDVDNVSELARQYVLAMKEREVIPVIKHFPGHGATKRDSHFFLPYVFDYKGITDYHMVPFNKLFKTSPALMVGHIRVRKLAKFLPASINNVFISKYIMNDYKGLIISDEINMLKRHLLYRMSYVDRALKSYNDIILVKIKSIDEGYKIIDKYKRILENDSQYVELLDNSLNKILDAKKKYNINDDVQNIGINVDKINNEIDKINSEVKDNL